MASPVKSHPGPAQPRTFPLPFPRSEYDGRRKRLLQAMEEAQLDVLMVTSHMDFHWISGSRVDFWASESPQWLVISEKDFTGIVRYLELQAHRCCSVIDDWVVYYDEGPINPYDPVRAAAEVLKEKGYANKRIGFSHRVVSAEDFQRFQTLLPDAEFVHFSIANVRVKRSELELDCFRKAASVNQAALMSTIDELGPGMSEWGILKQIARRHAKMLGSDYFRSAMSATCCQIGRHMMHMHVLRTPSEMKGQKLQAGSGIWLEPGVFYKEYVGSMLRTVWFGEPPREVYAAVSTAIEAFELLLGAIGPGKTAHEVDGVVRSFLAGKGYDIRSYQHRTGYTSSEKWLDGGILSLTPNNPLVLEPGHVFHCPVHVYVPGYGYMGVSEQIAITDNGHEVIGDFNRVCPRKLFLK